MDFRSLGCAINPTTRMWLRRAGYVLLALSVLNLIIALFFLAYAIMGPADRRSIASVQTIINFGFALANGFLGTAAMVAGRRST